MSNLISREAAAERLGLSLRSFIKIVKGGEIPVVEIGRRRLFREDDLASFVEQRVRKGASNG